MSCLPPMALQSRVTSTMRNSGTPHRLISLLAFSFPAAWATINSVPPAIGVHFPGAAASNSSTPDRLPGAISSCACVTAHLPALAFELGMCAAAATTDSKIADESCATAKIPLPALPNFDSVFKSIAPGEGSVEPTPGRPPGVPGVPGVPALRAVRRRALRQDGAQRHRGRLMAAIAEGLSVSRGPTSACRRTPRTTRRTRRCATPRPTSTR